ncbi:hypothetical protein H0H92_009543 [Tricholoma furcatifolium]|nr:hypothetical protein H0H92_009543 [Tricholoma furcatifolium]
MTFEQASPFPLEAYNSEDFISVWKSIRAQFPAPKYSIDAAVFNIGHTVWKPFLEVTPQDIRTSLEINVESAFAFSREAILTFKENKVSEDKGKRGTLIFTGATAGLRGNVETSAFAAAKFGIRALSQSLAKEFGKENIHAVIDGVILNERLKDFRSEVVDNPDARLHPDDVAETVGEYLLHNIRSKYDFRKHYLPPLRKLSPVPETNTNAQGQRRRRTARERERDRRLQEEREASDKLSRSIEKRRWIYSRNLYAKHVASNAYTRYRPFPNPAQFAASNDLITRTTIFLRRELQVWNDLDIEVGQRIQF